VLSSIIRERVTVCCENRTEHTNTLSGQNAEFCSVLKQLGLKGLRYFTSILWKDSENQETYQSGYSMAVLRFEYEVGIIPAAS
jgi:hypothetical protein